MQIYLLKIGKSLAPGGIIAIEDYAFNGLFLYPRKGRDYESISGSNEVLGI